MIKLNAAIALGRVRGPEIALEEVDAMADRLADYHLLHATRAQLLTELGDHEAARAANERALALTQNTAEQHLLRTRIDDQLSR